MIFCCHSHNDLKQKEISCTSWSIHSMASYLYVQKGNFGIKEYVVLSVLVLKVKPETAVFKNISALIVLMISLRAVMLLNVLLKHMNRY